MTNSPPLQLGVHSWVYNPVKGLQYGLRVPASCGAIFSSEQRTTTVRCRIHARPCLLHCLPSFVEDDLLSHEL